MISLDVRYFNEIIADLRYAKEFKTPLVLFTSTGMAIGLGEEMSFVKTEIGIQHECYMRNYIIETKALASFLKELDNQVGLKFDFKPNFLEIDNPLNSIGISIAPSYTEYNVKAFLYEASTFQEVYAMQYKKDNPFMVDMKKLHADEGAVNLFISNRYYLPMHKKILSYTATDDVYLTILDKPESAYFFARFDVINKKKNTNFNIYIKALKV